jgi:hypothetical protein
VSCLGARRDLEQNGRRLVIASTLITFERTTTCNTIHISTCDGFGYHIGPTPYDTQILFAAHRRPLHPTVALDSPPFVLVYLVVFCPCPRSSPAWLWAEEENIAVNRIVVIDPLQHTTTASRRTRHPFWARGTDFCLTLPHSLTVITRRAELPSCIKHTFPSTTPCPPRPLRPLRPPRPLRHRARGTRRTLSLSFRACD